MYNKTIIRNGFSRLLASPEHCVLLHQIGITHRTHFHWKYTDKEIVPVSYVSDPDKYYESPDQTLVQCGIQTLIPAYSLQDFEIILENTTYKLAKENSVYQLEVNLLIENHEVTSTTFSDHAADAFAAVVLDLIQQKVLMVGQVNLAIMKSLRLLQS